MKTIILVTVTIYSEDGADSFATYVSETETLETAIEEARDSALERYEEGNGNLPMAHRIIIHVDEIPEPKARGTIVRAKLPEQADDDTITATVIA